MKARLGWTKSNMAEDSTGAVSSSTGDSSQTGGRGKYCGVQGYNARFMITKVPRPGLLIPITKTGKSRNDG